MSRKKICFTALSLAISACNGEAVSDTSHSAPVSVSPLTDPEAMALFSETDECPLLSLKMRRNADQSFTLAARKTNGDSSNCRGDQDATIDFTSERGTLGTVFQHGSGIWSTNIGLDAARTGEYRVSAAVSEDGQTHEVTETALVFHAVNPRWGQARAVKGAVNTLGWEDSPFITPDGEYLFTMVLPISPSCVLENTHAKNANCKQLRGRVDDAVRPQFKSRFTGGRISRSGDLDWNCLEVGGLYTKELFQRYEVYTPPMITYGFRRQPDGSFDEPFAIGVGHVSGCVAPSGFEAHPRGDGSARAFMGLIDPAAWNTDKEDDYPDLFTALINLDEPNELATWDTTARRLKNNDHNLRLIFGQTMPKRQDNPHAVRNPTTGKFELVLWDSEHQEEDIFYRVLDPVGSFPAGPWGPVRKIPVFAERGVTEIQPFFDGKSLTVTRRYELASRDFNGSGWADLANKTAWGPERIEIAVDPTLKGSEKNVMHAVGDATYAIWEGRAQLFFVYMTRRDDGELDLNIGYVEEH